MQSTVSRLRSQRRELLEGPGILPAVWLATVCLVVATSASAGPEVAPAGPCATPREAISGASQSSGPTSPFSVVGPLGALFNPADVAAAPVLPSRPVPSASAMVRPGPCDNPGGGCGVTPERGVPLIVGGGRP